MEWLVNRLREPSTWSALGGLVASVGVLGKIDEAPAVADALSNQGIIFGGMAASILGVFLGEKGRG